MTAGVLLLLLATGSEPGPISTATPAMTWSSWNYWESHVNESALLATADALVSSGLAALGYDTVSIDAGWAEPLPHQRDARGVLVPDKAKWPRGMKAVGDALHAKGLRFGLYGDLSNHSCGGPSFMGHEELDMQTFADWGVDYLKVDFCGYKIGPSAGGLISIDPGPQLAAWTKLGAALEKTGRKIWFSICPHAPATEPMAWEPPHPGRSAPGGGGSPACPPSETCPVIMYAPPPQWSRQQRRSLSGANGNSILVEYGNTIDGWDGCDSCGNTSVLKHVGLTVGIDAGIAATNLSYGGAGSFNDMDMLQLCNFGEAPTGHATAGMTLSEYRLEYSAWSILASNLILGNDVVTVREKHPECFELMMNKAIVAVSQDPAALPPRLVYSVPPMAANVSSAMITQQVLARPLSGGRLAVLLLNRGAAPARMSATWAQLGLPAGASCSVYDVIAQRDTGTEAKDTFIATVASHDVSFVILKAAASVSPGSGAHAPKKNLKL